jgi:hypothetical protein
MFGKNIGAHIADMLIIIHRRAAGVDVGLAHVDRLKWFQRAGHTVEEF